MSVELNKRGFEVQRIPNDSVGYGALEVWRVSRVRLRNSFPSFKAPQVGAVWAVYSDGKSLDPDVQDFTGPIDAVYTWVDSADPEWQESFLKYLELVPQGKAHPSSRDLARYTSRDELKYSLRSLEMHLPWIRNIYIVTAGQVPSWLVADHPQIKIIDHRDIFQSPSTSLPTFNSHAIETQISRIPGLSEHFLYVNDDIFFGRTLSPNTFFTASGQVKYALTKAHFSEAKNPDLAINLAAKHNGRLISDKYGRTTSLKFRHVAHPQRLEIHRLILDSFEAEVTETANHKFRHVGDISVPSSLAHYVAAAEGLGVPVDVDYAYIDLGSDHLAFNLYRLLRNPAKQMFCLNEVSTVSQRERRGRITKRVLDSLFPFKSSYEK